MKLEPRPKIRRGERATTVLRQEDEFLAAGFDPFQEVPEGTWELVEATARDIDEDRIEALGFRLARLAVVDPRIVETVREAGQLEKLLKLVRVSFEKLDEQSIPTNELRDAADLLVFGPEVRRVVEPFLPELFIKVQVVLAKNLRRSFGFMESLRVTRAMLQWYPERQAELREEYRRVLQPELLLIELPRYCTKGMIGTALAVGADFKVVFPDLRSRIEEVLQPFWPLVRQELAGATPDDILNLKYDVLRDAAFILADEAYIDEQGDLHVEKRPEKITSRPPLPDRPHV